MCILIELSAGIGVPVAGVAQTGVWRNGATSVVQRVCGAHASCHAAPGRNVNKTTIYTKVRFLNRGFPHKISRNATCTAAHHLGRALTCLRWAASSRDRSCCQRGRTHFSINESILKNSSFRDSLRLAQNFANRQRENGGRIVVCVARRSSRRASIAPFCRNVLSFN